MKPRARITARTALSPNAAFGPLAMNDPQRLVGRFVFIAVERRDQGRLAGDLGDTDLGLHGRPPRALDGRAQVRVLQLADDIGRRAGSQSQLGGESRRRRLDLGLPARRSGRAEVQGIGLIRGDDEVVAVQRDGLDGADRKRAPNVAAQDQLARLQQRLDPRFPAAPAAPAVGFHAHLIAPEARLVAR